MNLCLIPLNVDSIQFHYYISRLSCGFPSPADDYLASPLTLSELLVDCPNSTYFVKASGTSMINRGILDGAILTVDRSKPYENGATVVAAIDGELTCKILDKKNRRLLSANPDFPSILIEEDMDVVLQGVVTWAINPQ
ncbi:MAG: DNA polymerase V [Cellvibrionaceae bacterium]|jgi:DNA polymerase V